MLPGNVQPPAEPGAGAAWLALASAVGSLAPLLTLLALVLFGGGMSIDAAAVLFLSGPAMGILAVVLGFAASVRAERWGTILPRALLTVAILGGLLGVISSGLLLVLLLDGVPSS